MTRPLFVALIATGLAGCSSYRKVDPIYGRQAIPSQRTGAVGSLDYGTPPPRYYDSESGSGGSSAVPSPPPSGGDLAPPGGFDFQGDANSGASNRNGGWGPPHDDSTPSRPASSGTSGAPPLGRTGPQDFGSGGSGSDYGTSQYEKYQPGSGSSTNPPRAPSSYPETGNDLRPRGETNSRGFDPLRRLRDDRPAQLASRGDSRGSTPRRLEPDDAIDILELPSGEPSRGTVRQDREIQPATFTQPTSEWEAAPQSPSSQASQVSPVSTSAPSDKPYDYDRGYRWLKGRLEYSSMHRRWTLRYISLSDESDRYGGSVMLQDTTALKDRTNGDFVIVHGGLLRSQDPSSFSPFYRVDQLTLVR